MNFYEAKAAYYYKNMYGEPFKLSYGQQRIFRAVYEPEFSRVAIKTTTQYGKSEVASLALLTIAVERREKILIVAPSTKQAGIIMSKIIDHIFDHTFITSMIDYSSDGSLQKLRAEKSKSRITFKNGSEIMILTADVRSMNRESKNLMGFGATIVLVDESSLIPDTMWAKILRMVGGVRDGKIIQLGNPFEFNHFGKAFEDKEYLKISINWKVALKEGRLTQKFLDEARATVSEMDWTIFYEVMFPEGGAEDALIPSLWIQKAIEQEGCEGDFKQTGLDVARFGRDKTVYAYRKGGVLSPLEVTEKMDTMEVAGWTRGKLDRDTPQRHCTDVIGLGAGTHDRLEEMQGDDDVTWSECDLIPVNVAESPIDKTNKNKFTNLRAQVYWYLRTLFKPDDVTGKSQISIPKDMELIKQLGEIRYRYSSEKKIKIEPKDEMKKRLGVSPDKADAVALAFWDYQAEAEPQMWTFSD